LASTSKIPPQIREPRLEVGERGGDLVQSFGFHRIIFLRVSRAL